MSDNSSNPEEFPVSPAWAWILVVNKGGITAYINTFQLRPQLTQERSIGPGMSNKSCNLRVRVHVRVRVRLLGITDTCLKTDKFEHENELSNWSFPFVFVRHFAFGNIVKIR